MQQAQEAMSRVRVSANYGSVHVAEAFLSEANSVLQNYLQLPHSLLNSIFQVSVAELIIGLTAVGAKLTDQIHTSWLRCRRRS